MKKIATSAGLSTRECEIAFLRAERLSSAEIAERLFISRHTVEKHLEHIYSKLKASGKRELRDRLLGDGLTGTVRPSWRLYIPTDPR